MLDALLPKTRQGILAAIFVQPEKSWYVSELAVPGRAVLQLAARIARADRSCALAARSLKDVAVP